MISPDQHANGFLREAPAAERYENVSTDPGDVAAKLAALIPRGAKVLDVGCGTGSVSFAIRELSGAQLIGIEPDAQRVKIALDRGLNVFPGYLSAAFLHEHGPFDAIIFADVLEHLPNPAEIVLLAKQGLTPGGAIVASVPNIAHWFVRQNLLFGRFDYQDCGIMDATHLRWFTRKTLRGFFNNLGFAITRMDVTVNNDLPDYQHRAPWRWIKPRVRRKVVGGLVSGWPTLFGCQHIIRAEPDQAPNYLHD